MIGKSGKSLAGEVGLTSHLSHVVCPLCLSGDVATVSMKDRRGAALESCCCCDCGLVFNNPVPGEEELRRFYAEKYRLSYKKTRIPRLKHHVRYAGWVAGQIEANPEIYRRAQSMLDIGSGSGEALALMRGVGCAVQGVEPARDYADYVSRTFGVPVFNGSIDDFASERRFDLIRLNHVLEHMRDPVEKLRLIRGFLAEDGILHVEVPDIRVYFRVKSPGRVFHYGHIYNFAAETLLMTAARAGLREEASFAPTSVYFRKCAPFEIPPDPGLSGELIAMSERNRKGEYRKLANLPFRLAGKLARALSERAAVQRLGTPLKIVEHFSLEVRAALS